MTLAELQATDPALTGLRYDYDQIAPGHRERVIRATNTIRDFGAAWRGSMLRIGQELIEVKKRLPYGQFSEWIATEFDLSQRMAQNFMNVAKLYADRGNEIISPLSDTVLYLLAAPSTPDEARAEVEQAASEGKKITVEFAEQTIRKHRPEPVQYTPVWELEHKIGMWLSDQIGEGGTPTADTVLDNLKLQTKEPLRVGGWYDLLCKWLDGLDVVFRVNELHQAINNVREQRRQAQRIAAAKVVYVEPEPKVEPVAPVGGGALTGEWLMHILTDAHPDSADFKAALEAADESDLRRAYRRQPGSAVGHTRAQAIGARVAMLGIQPSPLISRLISPDIPTAGTEPGTLYEAVQEANAEQLEEALGLMSDDMRKARGRVLEFQVRKLKAAAQETATVAVVQQPALIDTSATFTVSAAELLSTSVDANTDTRSTEAPAVVEPAPARIGLRSQIDSYVAELEGVQVLLREIVNFALEDLSNDQRLRAHVDNVRRPLNLLIDKLKTMDA